ncbi:hypothetical protein BKH46_06090 [Helicobacter sp. 12S02634-8]|uniref:outer membrane family protein n=1 Tax=Helicobacter sp. 12S02634-8 TaxID=1476199 RepID=UPI000BA72264|nr:outer membrane family protein [Helicobacter sp. 12S02634-8]PAF46788.1 hypothetical protein BKH46_06090 [Helicobacter sp. 12S02634-8]
MDSRYKMMIKFLSVLLGMCLCLKAFDSQFHGSVSSFSKLGFNNHKADLSSGRFPTESYSFLNAGMDFNFGLGYGFNLGLGGYVGGVVYDGSKQVQTTQHTPLNPDGIIYNLFGFWSGSNAATPATAHNAKYYTLTNAYLGYQYADDFVFKIGRFKLGGDLGTDWLTSYVQGLALSSGAIPHTKLWFFTINKRAFVGGSWFKDFKYINPNLAVDNGKGFYIYAGGANITYKNFNINAYIYAQDSRFIAPGFRAKYDQKPSPHFGFKTEILGLFMTHFAPGMRKTSGFNNYPQGSAGSPQHYETTIPALMPTIGKGGVSLMFKQTSYVDIYDFGFVLYKNFGNPNEFLGSVGDPTGYDNWTNSVYDSATWNNAFRRDALDIFLFANASYERLKLGLLARLTHAKRADEQSLSLSMAYQFAHGIDAGFKAEYYNNTTFKGYTLGLPPSAVVLSQNISQDRSFIQTFINYQF